MSRSAGTSTQDRIADIGQAGGPSLAWEPSQLSARAARRRSTATSANSQSACASPTAPGHTESPTSPQPKAPEPARSADGEVQGFQRRWRNARRPRTRSAARAAFAIQPSSIARVKGTTAYPSSHASPDSSAVAVSAHSARPGVPGRRGGDAEARRDRFLMFFASHRIADAVAVGLNALLTTPRVKPAGCSGRPVGLNAPTQTLGVNRPGDPDPLRPATGAQSSPPTFSTPRPTKETK